METALEILFSLTVRGALGGIIALLLFRILRRRLPRWAIRAALLLVLLAFVLPIHPPILGTDPLPRIPLPSSISTSVAVDSGTPHLKAPLPPQIPWTPILFAIWLAGAVFSAARTVPATLLLHRRFSRHRLCTDPQTLDLLEDLKAETGVHSPVAVILSRNPVLPALWGCLRPRILLPETTWREFSETRRKQILLHELAHIRARDIPARWFLHLVCSLHWFNPAVHLVARRFRLLQEECADACVTATSPDRSAGTYAETLLAVLRSGAHRGLPAAAIGISESARQLKERILTMNTPPAKNSILASAILLLSLGAVVLLTPIAPVAASEESEKDAAVAAMLPWLETIDKGNYAKSYAEASKLFRDAVTKDQWIAALGQVRKPLGALKSRKLASAALLTTLPNGTKGTYILAQFNTSFQNLAEAVETVTFEKESDGQWLASGYFIRPGHTGPN